MNLDKLPLACGYVSDVTGSLFTPEEWAKLDAYSRNSWQPVVKLRDVIAAVSPLDGDMREAMEARAYGFLPKHSAHAARMAGLEVVTRLLRLHAKRDPATAARMAAQMLAAAENELTRDASEAA